MTQDDRGPEQKAETPAPAPAGGDPPDLLLGRIAVDWNLISPQQLADGLRERELTRTAGQEASLGDILTKRGWLTTEDLIRVLEERNRVIESEVKIPRYEVRGRLGEGATAFVFRAWDRELRRTVALKVLRDSAGLSEVARERFRREAQAAAQIAHPNVLSVYDAGEHGGKLYQVMELVEGKSLHDVMNSPGWNRKSAPALLEKAARGVAAAHARGIVHRDLKPGNILIAKSGDPKVGDFGLAHLPDATQALTRTGAILGTPLYMAPEQVEGKEVSARTDVYALGAILYEALVGRPPHKADRLSQLYRKIVRDEPLPPRRLVPDLSPELETVVLKALEHDPARRYPDAAAFADDLGRYLEGRAVEAVPRSRAYRYYKLLRRHGTAALAGLAAAAWLGILGIGAWVNVAREGQLRKERREALESMRETARVSVDAALGLRRAGDPEGMKRFLPSLEGAYERASRLASGLAEVDYLMGRMHRALMRDASALEYQARALEKDPDFAPALYERIVLRARAYDAQYRAATDFLRSVEIHRVTTREIPRVRPPTPDEVERSRPGLRELRLSVIADCEKLRGLLTSRRSEDAGRWIGEAHTLAADGILAYAVQKYDEGRSRLEEAVKREPLMEEAWEALARVLEGMEATAGSTREKDALRRAAHRVYEEALPRDLAYLPFRLGRGNLVFRDAVAKFRSGKDPLADLGAAEKDFEECVRIDGQHAEAWQRLGSVRIDRGRYFTQRGKDPLPDWENALKNLEHSLAFKGDSFLAWSKRGWLRLLRGAYEKARGGDPLPDWNLAEQDFMEALRLQTANPEPWLRLGLLRSSRGLHGAKRGEDPVPLWRIAELNFSEALRIAPGYGEALARRGALRLSWAQYLADRGGDVDPPLRQAEEDLTAAVDSEDLFVEAQTLRGVIRHYRGLYLARRDADPLPEWARAEEDFRRAAAEGPCHAGPRQGMGDLAWSRAAHFAARGDAARAKAEYAECAREYAEAIKINPSSERVLGERKREARSRSGP